MAGAYSSNYCPTQRCLSNATVLVDGNVKDQGVVDQFIYAHNSNPDSDLNLAQPPSRVVLIMRNKEILTHHTMASLHHYGHG